jgi:hypothetical protein
MKPAPIPQRVPPLTWRGPTFVWTPLALALAVGGPAALLAGDGALMQFALVAGATIYAMALTTLGGAWALGRAPRTRREVVLHVLAAGAIASVLAPFVLTELLSVVANYEHAGAGDAFTFGMSLSIMPLALVLGLPITLATAIVFSIVALERPRIAKLSEDELRHQAQSFR